MHQQQITGDGARLDVGEHALELGTVIIARRCAGIDIARDDHVPAFGAIALGMSQLIGDRQVVIGLPCGRDAGIDNDAHAIGSILAGNAALGRLGLGDFRFYHRGDQLGKMGFDQRQFACLDWKRIGKIDSD
jgi:hypothetical protein